MNSWRKPRLFQLPLVAEQLAKVDGTDAELRAEGFTAEDLDDIRATLTRYYR